MGWLTQKYTKSVVVYASFGGKKRLSLHKANTFMKHTIVYLFLIAIFFAGCSSKVADYKLDPLTNWHPTTVGKFITYKVDSTIFINFGTAKVVRTGFVKDVFEQAVTDNLGRPSTRITRYFKRNLTDSWANANTFYATITDNGNTAEYIENNLRYIRLKNPVRNDFSWLGNSFIIETNSSSNDLDYLRSWNYTYKNIDAPYTVNAVTIPQTITVQQANSVIGDTLNPASVSEINKSIEVFGKGIGLIFKDFYHAEYQPASSGGSAGYRSNSYGIRLTMIDRN